MCSRLDLDKLQYVWHSQMYLKDTKHSTPCRIATEQIFHAPWWLQMTFDMQKSV
jgi:hypothetical protein